LIFVSVAGQNDSAVIRYRQGVDLVSFLLVLMLLAGAGGVAVWLLSRKKQRAAHKLADAREEAQRWYDRLGGQVMNLSGQDVATRQALVDAGERYNAAGSQLERAKTARQYELAGETALEGLMYIRAARIAMNLDPGPDLPELPSQRRSGVLTKEREVEVQGQTLRAGPTAGPQTPYYYPGGMVDGRPVPGGWYSTPWWKTALVAGASTLGTMMIFDALFSPSFADPGYGGFGSGYDSGFDAGYQQGLDQAGGDWSGGDWGGGDSWGGADSGGDWSGGDWSGGGDFGGDW
jgi:hypothetical protein